MNVVYWLRWQSPDFHGFCNCSSAFAFVLVRYHDGRQISMLIGKRNEPPSDKLGGELFISPHALVCFHYM